jgi:autotransporter translocation and assembly factor TamB
VLAIGKRLSDQVYLEYEQGITTAANVVRLSLALTRRLSLRAETNQRTSGFGLSFQRAFD